MKLKQIRVDGYKNLIDCVVDLGDFNVLVGPNNSGKSNLLEVLQQLGALCFGSEELRDLIFEGSTPPNRSTSWVCHLEECYGRPLTIGVCFETVHEDNKWIVDYEVKIRGGSNAKENAGFCKETLKAKRPWKTGPMTTYVARDGRVLQIGRQEKDISLRNSAFNAISSLFPDYKGLPKELEVLIEKVKALWFYSVYAMWPEGLRTSINQEEAKIGAYHVSTFDPIKVVDEVKEGHPEKFELFREAFCDILDLEDITLFAKTLGAEENEPEGGNGKRFRYCTVKRGGSKPAGISEYSDGTFAVFGVLAALMAQKEWSPAFCLEEPENCLHPAALEKLLRFLQDNSDRWPVLITTHSPYLLNGVNPEDVRVAVVDDETGAVHFEHVKNSRELRDYLNKGLMSFGDLLESNYDRFRE